MSIDLSRVTGISDSRGVITEIRDSLGRVIWSAVKEVGTLILRPSADISVGHFCYPATSDAPGYQRINEEVSDGSATSIRTPSTNDGFIGTVTSEFGLSGDTSLNGKSFLITDVTILGDPLDSTYGPVRNEFSLRVNGVETASIFVESKKGIDLSVSVSGVIDLINSHVIKHKTLPDINIIIKSHSYMGTDNKGGIVESGVSQVYVVLGYEA